MQYLSVVGFSTYGEWVGYDGWDMGGGGYGNGDDNYAENHIS